MYTCTRFPFFTFIVFTLSLNCRTCNHIEQGIVLGLWATHGKARSSARVVPGAAARGAACGAPGRGWRRDAGACGRSWAAAPGRRARRRASPRRGRPGSPPAPPCGTRAPRAGPPPPAAVHAHAFTTLAPTHELIDPPPTDNKINLRFAGRGLFRMNISPTGECRNSTCQTCLRISVEK